MAAGAGVWIRPFRDGQHRVYYRLEPGATLHGSRGFKDYDEAERWADAMRAKITTRRRTVGDAIASYRADLDARVARNELRAESATQMEQGLERLLADVLELPLASLTPRRCHELYEALANSPGVAVSTQHRLHAFAHSWGAWAAKRKWFKANPWGEVEKIGKRADHRDEALRVNEARKLRDKALELARAGSHDALAALIVLTFSLRPSEVAQMTVRDVDDDGRVLWVAGRRLKNENTRRAMTVADDALQPLLVAVAEGRDATEPLLPRHTHRNRVTEAVQRVSAAAGVPTMNSRALRRTYSTLQARRGVSLDELAFSMGHGADASARVAQKHYIAPGAVQSGASRRVLEGLDGGARSKRR